MRHIWSVLSDKSLINEDSGQISMIDCLEVINLPEEMAREIEGKKVNIPIKLEILSLWVDENNNVDSDRKIDVKIDYIDPKGNEMGSLPQTFELHKGFKRIRSRIKVIGLAVNGLGDYLFRVSFKDNKDKDYLVASEIPLTIQVGKPKQDSPTSEIK